MKTHLHKHILLHFDQVDSSRSQAKAIDHRAQSAQSSIGQSSSALESSSLKNAFIFLTSSSSSIETLSELLSSNHRAPMASNLVIFGASLLYSLILVLQSSQPFSIIDLIQSITHLLPSNPETQKDHSYSQIYSNVMKGAFVYSIATVLLSITMTFSTYSSLRELITAITYHWKPFLASLAAAVIFPTMLRPPNMVTPFGSYFDLTLFHAISVVFLSIKLVTMPMLEEKFQGSMELPKGLSWKFIFWQVLVSIMQIGTLYLYSKEAYKMQLVFGIVCEVMHLIWLASTYELMVFTVLIYENKKKMLAGEGSSCSEKVESSSLLLEERLP